MIKIFYRSFISLIILLLITVVYLSTIGFKTDRFNSKIISQIKQIDSNIKIKLNDVKIKLDPFNLGIDAKTIGTDLIYGNKKLQIETIKSKISIKSFLDDKFSLVEISISTKPLEIKDLIAFVRLLNNNSKLFIAEKLVKKGFVIADLKLEFDETGKINKNYKLNGFVKDGKISLIKKYDLNKIDFLFEIDEKTLKFNDIKISQKNNNLLIPELIAVKQKNKYLISGTLISKNTSLTKNEIFYLINDDFKELDIQEISFSSKNDFKFEINKKFKIDGLNIKSDIDLENLKFKNLLKLKSIFPNVRDFFIFKNQKLKLEYKKDDLKISGKGDILFQDKIDEIVYEVLKKNNEIKFDTKLRITNNAFKINLLDFKKDKNSELDLNFIGKRNTKGKLVFNKIYFKEKNNVVSIKNLILSKNNKIDEIGNININYADKKNFKNDLKLIKKSNNYLVSGNSFNINKIIDELLGSGNNKKKRIFNKNFKIIFDVKKIYLDKDNFINNLKGFLLINKNEISELSLESKFSNNENIKFTIKDNGSEKITTLYSYKAKPFVNRYKFIKGFEEGNLDFYSVKKNGITNSTLKIDNFKIQEIPVLAKLLTLASLQGIADLLTGEGIRFTDFEMKFSSKDRLMTIQELYAIGPAISILMEGYIQKKKLISLRGTLVPATTVNRTISSIPLIGDILVGKKVGEGVFGVSFKIKGPPNDLETTVNPIKTLTPRFITRTLEKIKKN